MHFLPDVTFAGLVMVSLFVFRWRAKSIQAPRSLSWRRQGAVFALTALTPVVAQAQTVDLRTATEAGNAIIMYLSGAFAAIGIVAAGVAMMTGRQSIAKWAFAGAMVSGLAFAIVRTMWSSMGLEAADVGSF